MLKLVLVACLASLALAQDLPFLTAGVLVDTIHGYGVEYDDNHNIIVVVGPTDCYIVETTNERTWDNIITTQTLLHEFTETVYKQIQAQLGLHSMTFAEMNDKYHSSLANRHCRERDIFRMNYVGPNTR